MIDFTGWSHPASTFVNWRRKKAKVEEKMLIQYLLKSHDHEKWWEHFTGLEIFQDFRLSKLLALTCLLCVGPTLAESFWHCLGSWRSPCACLVGWQSRCWPCCPQRKHCWTETVTVGGCWSALRSVCGNKQKAVKIVFVPFCSGFTSPWRTTNLSIFYAPRGVRDEFLQGMVSILALWKNVFNANLLYFVCMSILYVHIDVYHVCLWCSWKPEKALRSPGTQVTEGFELPCGC